MRPLKVLFAEPPAERRIGGIETALRGLAAALPAAEVTLTRSVQLNRSSIAEADVVHFHGLWEFLHHRARGWCGELGKPFIVSPHGMLEDWAFRHRAWKKWPYFHLVERRSLTRADVLLATSAEEAASLGRWFSSPQVEVMPLGTSVMAAPDHAESRRKLGLAPEEFVVLFLSRCHQKKGLHLLIEALGRVAATATKKIRLLIVGEGDSRYVEPLRRTTQSWRGNVRCTWAGAVWGVEKWTYLSAADLFCLPSYSENFGLVVVEALFAGTPVLTTFATPWPSLRGSLPVHLIPPTVDDLVAALETRLRHPVPDVVERSHTRQDAIARFDWSALAPHYLALYRRLADSSSLHAN